MLNKLISLFVAAVLSFALFSPDRATAQDLSFLSDSVSYLWPTNASTQLSSTFAETRSAHLHAGIDIRTWGREGYEVYATRDGVVHRVGISPSGYGKVIYLKHNDESYSVYAHLHRFEPGLMAYADSIRLKDYRFEIDRLVDDKTFSFKRGDIIGYSGSTGVGPPHLHFELRTPDFQPFNPLLTNLSVRDDIPPVFTALAIEAFHPENLKLKSHRIIRPEHSSGGVANFGTIEIDSPIGLAVDVHDRANQSPNLYAVHQLLMIAGEDTLFHSKADQFIFTQSRMMFLDRSYPILAETRRGFQRLYVATGNELPFYVNLQNQGVLALSEGDHEITIIAKDVYGNSSTAMVTVSSKQDHSRQEGISSVPAYPYHNINTGYSIRRTHPNLNKRSPSYFLTHQSATAAGPSGNGNGRSIYSKSNDLTASSKQIIPGRRSTLPSSNNRAWIQIPSNALYDTLSITFEYITDEGLPVVRFTPDRLPVKTPLTVTMMLPDELQDDPHIGLFSYDHHRNRSSFISSRKENGMLKAEINEISELRIKRDRIAPWAGNPKLKKDLGGNYVLELPVVDRDSGIDFRRSDIRINGKRGIIEYDRDKNLLIFYHPDFEPSAGTNRVEATVYDRIGNRTERSYSVNYLKQ